MDHLVYGSDTWMFQDSPCHGKANFNTVCVFTDNRSNLAFCSSGFPPVLSDTFNVTLCVILVVVFDESMNE